MKADDSALSEMMEALSSHPKRDNTGYHQALAAARRAYAEAEAQWNGPVEVSVKTKRKKSGALVVKWVFRAEKSTKRDG